MTREEAIADIRDNIKTVVGGISLDMAIEALEQEPCIQEKQANADKIDAVYIDGFKAGYSQARFDLEQEPCEDAISRKAVLDKIRAEIDEQYDRVHPYNISCADGLEMALEIIDKHKAESEDEE